MSKIVEVVKECSIHTKRLHPGHLVSFKHVNYIFSYLSLIITTVQLIVKCGIKKIFFSVRGLEIYPSSTEGVATSPYLLLLLRTKYCCCVLETSCVCFNSHFLSKLAKKPPSKLHIPRIFGETSLWRQMKGFWYFCWYQWKEETHTYPLVPKSFIGGFTTKIYGGNHPLQAPCYKGKWPNLS